MATVDEKVARVEGILEEVRAQTHELRADFRQLRGDFRWLLGIQITMWITIIIAVVFTR